MTNNFKTILEQEKDKKLILTPRINEYVMSHAGSLYSEAALERVWHEMVKPDRERSGSFSASSAGQCLRRQELAFLGKPQAPIFPALRETFESGHWYHRRWQALLLSAGLIEEIEVPLFWPKYTSKGSADGRGFIHWETADPKYQGREFILEIKSVGAFAWNKKAEEGPSEEHIMQMHRYMLVSGIHLCIYVIIDKGNTSGLGWKEFIIEADPARLKKSEDELIELNKALEQKKLHPLLTQCKLGQGSTYAQCPFTGSEKNGGVCKSTKEWG